MHVAESNPHKEVLGGGGSGRARVDEVLARALAARSIAQALSSASGTSIYFLILLLMVDLIYIIYI